jgi:hypothetical protein
MENKTGKYLKYAVGEIVLVVIGILIALSINNWNQDRLNKKQVYRYLTNLTEDLKSDIILYDNNIRAYENDKANNSQILINDNYKKLDTDSIFTLIRGYWMLNQTSDQTFQKIKSAGLLEILGTPEINKAINDYYNLWISRYDYLIEFDKELTDKDDYFWTYNDKFESNSPSFLESSKLPFQDNPAKRKEDLIKLTESTLGRNYLRNAIGRDEYAINVVKNIKSKANNLLMLIEKEISRY